MAIKLRDLKAEARVLVRVGELGSALCAYDHILTASPLDYDSRLKIADLLARAGDRAGAAAVYRAVAMHDIRSGHPLPGLVACKQLQALGERADDLIDAMASLYAHGAPSLAKFAARQAPVDLDSEVPPADLSRAPALAVAAENAAARALEL
jgi:hypothetical protein